VTHYLEKALTVICDRQAFVEGGGGRGEEGWEETPDRSSVTLQRPLSG
jgi:hypothetical protein